MHLCDEQVLFRALGHQMGQKDAVIPERIFGMLIPDDAPRQGQQFFGIAERLRPGKRTLDGVGEQAPRRRAFHHGCRHSVDALGSSFRTLGGGCLHARQTGVDALDGLIGFVHLDGDDQFEFVIGHGSPVLTGG